MTERRHIGDTVTYDFTDRQGEWVSASAFFIRGRVYELVYSWTPHWLAENVHFDLTRGSHANGTGESLTVGLGKSN